jgi:hypothetical protein
MTKILAISSFFGIDSETFTNKIKQLFYEEINKISSKI